MKLKASSTIAAIALSCFGAACGVAGEDTEIKSGTGGGVITGASSSGSGFTSSSSGAGVGGAGGSSQKKGPPYPIVLSHGFFGFEDFAGAGFLTYFYNVKAYLEQKGEIVYTPSVDPFNDSSYRGQQLIGHIEDILAETGYEKVIIIGHSQGGLDARVVAHDRPDLVAAVVTIGTPHYGTPVADIAVKLASDPNATAIIDALAKLLGGPLYDQIGNDTSLTKALHLFSKPGIGAFNTKYTDSPGVFYASIAGRTSYKALDGDCKSSATLPFISAWDKELDPLDPLFSVIQPVIKGGLGYDYAHDGLVRAKDAHWGEFWGCVPADHLDQVGQLFGDSPGLGNDWKYLPFYADLVAYIHQRGY